MIIPVKCFTCGTVIGNKYQVYCNEVRLRKMQLPKYKNDDNKNRVEYFTKENSEKTIEGHVLDQLGLNKMCCRRHMLTHVDIE
jgi:DNA-directed RNA polymerase subunit N